MRKIKKRKRRKRRKNRAFLNLKPLLTQLNWTYVSTFNLTFSRINFIVAGEVDKCLTDQRRLKLKLNTVEKEQMKKSQEIVNMKTDMQVHSKDSSWIINKVMRAFSEINKKIYQWEQFESKIEQVINLVKLQKETDLQIIKDDVIGLNDEKYKMQRSIRLLDEKVEKRFNEVETDIMELTIKIEGLSEPVIKNMENIGRENEAMLRELKRTQLHNREIIRDFEKKVSSLSPIAKRDNTIDLKFSKKDLNLQENTERSMKKEKLEPVKIDSKELESPVSNCYYFFYLGFIYLKSLWIKYLNNRF